MSMKIPLFNKTRYSIICGWSVTLVIYKQYVNAGYDEPSERSIKTKVCSPVPLMLTEITIGLRFCFFSVNNVQTTNKEDMYLWVFQAFINHIRI